MREHSPAIRMLMLVTIVALAAACGGGGSGERPSALPSGAPATKTRRREAVERQRIVDHLEAGRDRRVQHQERQQKLLIQPDTDNTFLLDPAISPDGKRIVYIVQPPPKIDAGKVRRGLRSPGG